MKLIPPKAMVITDVGSKLLSFGKFQVVKTTQIDKAKRAVKLSGYARD
jgi:hypothetical protein